MNMLMPQQGPGPSPASPSLAPSQAGNSLVSSLDAMHQNAKNHFAATGEAKSRMSRVRSELDVLMKLGDMVTPEDVVDGAGKLVAGGEDPMMMAGLLADMPDTGGEPLAGWVQMHDEATRAKEAQIAQAHEAARHQLGVSALHLLAGHSVEGGGAPAAPAGSPSGGPNQLGGQA